MQLLSRGAIILPWLQHRTEFWQPEAMQSINQCNVFQFDLWTLFEELVFLRFLTVLIPSLSIHGA